MRLRGISTLFCLCLFVGAAFARDKANKQSFSFQGHSRTYYAVIPDDPAPMPVLVLLHGSGRNGQIMAEAWQSLAMSEHFIVVAPDSYDSALWDSDHDPPAFLREVVNRIKAAHPIDEDRIYLFGHSAGAVYALALCLVESEYYAATAVHAGVLRPENYRLLARPRRHMPVAIWVGDRDLFFPVEAAKATQRKYDANGFHLELTVIPNHDHDYYAISDKVDRQAWEFLRRARLTPTEASTPQ